MNKVVDKIRSENAGGMTGIETYARNIERSSAALSGAVATAETAIAVLEGNLRAAQTKHGESVQRGNLRDVEISNSRIIDLTRALELARMRIDFDVQMNSLKADLERLREMASRRAKQDREAAQTFEKNVHRCENLKYQCGGMLNDLAGLGSRVNKLKK